MLIGHSGRVWEPENELLTDNSLLCTLHQTREIEGGEEGRVRKRERIAPTSLLHYLDFKDIVLLRGEKKEICLFMAMAAVSATRGFSSSVTAKMTMKSYLLPLSIKELARRDFFFQRNYSVIYLFAATRWTFFFLAMSLKLMRSFFSWIMSNNLCSPVLYNIVVAVAFCSKCTKFILSVS